MSVEVKGCRNAGPLVDELIDGTLDDARARAVRAHLRACEACNRKYEQTSAIVEAAGTLEPVDPPASLWARVSERLDHEDAAEEKRPGWWWWWHAWRRPLLFGGGLVAAAALMLVIVTSGRRPAADSAAPRADRTGGDDPAPTPRPSGDPGPKDDPGAHAKEAAPAAHTDLYSAALEEVERADAAYQQALGELRDIVKVERASWRPEAARAFDENLAAIEAAIERQRAAVRRQPADVLAVDALHAAYRKEIDYLQEAVLRAEGESL